MQPADARFALCMNYFANWSDDRHLALRVAPEGGCISIPDKRAVFSQCEFKKKKDLAP